MFSVWHPGFVKRMSMFDNVDEAMALGTVLAIRLKQGSIEGACPHSSTKFGVWI